MSRDRKPIQPQHSLNIEEFEIPLRDGYRTTLQIYRQTSRRDALPLFVYIHGGGFVTGSQETDDATCRAIAEQVPIIIVNVEYRLAPENKFPVGFEDCFDVVRWVASVGGQERLNSDLKREVSSWEGPRPGELHRWDIPPCASGRPFAQVDRLSLPCK
ncbi:Alpha/Beta hydrolase protein [Biscogniauxia mediterranea]|nr:Alpha/Beta hydrolase protein [Biscogniauxia mediterranea]